MTTQIPYGTPGPRDEIFGGHYFAGQYHQATEVVDMHIGG